MILRDGTAWLRQFFSAMFDDTGGSWRLPPVYRWSIPLDPQCIPIIYELACCSHVCFNPPKTIDVFISMTMFFPSTIDYSYFSHSLHSDYFIKPLDSPLDVELGVLIRVSQCIMACIYVYKYEHKIQFEKAYIYIYILVIVYYIHKLYYCVYIYISN